MDDDAIQLALKVEEGTMSQGLQVAFRNWKRQGNWFFFRALKRNAAYCPFDFAFSKAHFGLLTFRTVA